MRLVLTLLTLAAFVSAGTDVFYGAYKFSEEGPEINLLPPTRSQHHPRVCHASWAFAITNAMSVLFNKEKKGVYPEVVLSPQMLIHTRPEKVEFKCSGTPGFSIDPILEQLKTKGISSESCNNYFGDDTRKTDKLAECMDCHNNEDPTKEALCEFVPYRAHKLKSYRKIVSQETDVQKRNEDLRKQVLESFHANGPLICKLNHSAALFDKRLKNVEFYKEPMEQPDDSSWVTLVRHATNFKGVEAIGVLTSFGENIGYYGHVTLDASASVNPLGIFDSCIELVIDPVTPYIKDDKKISKSGFLSLDKGVKKVNGIDSKKHASAALLNQGYKPGFLGGAFNEGVVLSGDNQPINWQNKDGRNYLTYQKNQHIPVYCGSCWAQAAISAASDRLNIERIKKGTVFPKINLSVQAVINCKHGGSCNGGDQTALFQRAATWKIPVESCHPYESKNPDNFKCEPQKVCTLPIPGKDTVNLVKYSGVKVTKFTRIRGAEFIKQALLSGPVACSFQVTEEFVKYSRIEGDKLNIWTKNEDFLELNHAISVVGWGVQDGVEYWIARNSWGNEWGYDGHFYMELGKNLLGIESDCSAPEVVFEEFE